MEDFSVNKLKSRTFVRDLKYCFNKISMEFDTKMNLRKTASFKVTSSLKQEDFLKAVREILSAQSRIIGDDAGGSFWADYSTSIATRHLKCDVTLPDGEAEEGPTSYSITISAGKKPSYTLDVVMGFLALAIVWGFSKAMVPDPATFHLVVIFASCAILGFLLSLFGKAFGVKESKRVEDEIRSSLDGK